MNLLAHAGEQHDTISESIAHSSASASLFWLLLIAVPLVIYLVVHVVARRSLGATLLCTSFALLLLGVLSYSQPGLYSIVSLVVGFGLVLAQTILGLSTDDTTKN